MANLRWGQKMEKKRIIEKMKQLAELIHYDPGDGEPKPKKRFWSRK